MTILLLLLTLFLQSGSNQVELHWDPNSEPNLAGYNIYRSDQSQTFAEKLNSDLIQQTSYIDTAIVPGNTYFYVVSAVNALGDESGYSNEVFYFVPIPICIGDANQDGARNSLDVIAILNHIVGTNVLTGDGLVAADVNEDGTVNVLDTIKLQNVIVGNDTLPVCN